MATSLAAAFNYLIVFLGSKTNYNLEATFQIHGTFAIYAIIGFIGVVFLYFFLPETESKTLVEIEDFYKGNQKIFADDFFINSIRKNKFKNQNANKPMLVNWDYFIILPVLAITKFFLI